MLCKYEKKINKEKKLGHEETKKTIDYNFRNRNGLARQSEPESYKVATRGQNNYPPQIYWGVLPRLIRSTCLNLK